MIEPTASGTSLQQRLESSLRDDAEFARAVAQRDSIATALVDRLPTSGDLLLLAAGGAAIERAVNHAAESRRVVAVEFGRVALDRARLACRAGAVEWRDGFAEPDGWPPNSFAGVLAVEILTLLDDAEAWLARLNAAVAPGAAIVLATDFYAENTAVHRWRRAFDLPYKLLSSRGWLARIASAGFVDAASSRFLVSGAEPWRETRGTLILSGKKPRS